LDHHRTKIEVGTAWRHPAEYADIYNELGMIKLPVVNVSLLLFTLLLCFFCLTVNVD
jgi:hypothetical protein